MKFFIILLDEAVANNIINSDKLDETDVILFVYQEEGGEDKPVLSLKLYQKLMALKCRTEFIGLDVPKQDDLELWLAYLCGKYPGSEVIGSGEQLKRLWMLGVKTYPDLKCATASTSRGRERKKDTARIGRGGTQERKRKGKTNLQIEQSGNNLLLTSESNDRVESERSMDMLKNFLSELKTKDFDPSSLCMTIYSIAERVIESGSDMDEEIGKAVVIPEKIEIIKATLRENYDQIIEITKRIMENRAEHERGTLPT